MSRRKSFIFTPQSLRGAYCHSRARHKTGEVRPDESRHAFWRKSGNPDTMDPRRSDRTPYRPYGTARPSARPANVEAAVPYVRAGVRRLTVWRLKHGGMTLHVRLLRS
ncbi:MAG: hypothetical protein HY584_03055, partial [Candidatus Omnitrophica bacterium]|nr:hypothetical protein [Candidatus Omnitrophota bacterium]